MKCRWYQFWINRCLDDNQPLSDGVRAHVRACARCEKFYRDHTALTRQLSRGDEVDLLPSPFLKQRILNEIRSGDCSTTVVGTMRWIGFGAVASVALAFAILLSGNGSKKPARESSVNHAGEDWAAITAKMTSGQNLFRVATNLNQPLHQELDFVINDARAVLDTLKTEFVPKILLASSD